MKIARISLQNFKRFRNYEIQVRNHLTEEVADQFLLLGDNGTGKTTVLQAAALCLSMAAGRTRSVAEFDWLGWVPGRYQRWGMPVVEIDVEFAQSEIDATQEAADRWFKASRKTAAVSDFVLPGNSKVVTVRLEGERSSAQSAAELYQFRGRWYASQLLKTDPSARGLFESLPGVFWFDQFRNLATPPSPINGEDSNGREPFRVGVARFREHLNKWQLNKLAGARAKVDYLLELENNFKRLFPGRSFGLPEPMFEEGVPSPADFYFIINDGERTYDIEEMSAGEQAVFPMLFEFVRQRIRNAVVLIDEIDLNLHPPLAQGLLNALSAIGNGCQFLLTTHSEAISSVVSPEQIHRLPGGRLCL
jgi:predicted ATP-dependent endonuclease of OLD family